ncbi:DUF4350 domain-containing protein [Massilia atriviolacea]|uniref:DUF4350 domain-containing protein n=1 Tax=Massilia atriviolacea TaxID=2495579 RepID=A0A430HIF4_9BURK|nr:DUF4350 domain-containing protein [Massilia atriviolacea]RSZ57288.1 DUF4350 domain-containing protein [Massilia atriviolacea]
MSDSAKGILVAVALLLLGAFGYWWWHENMEQRWVSEAHTSSAASADPMLAATRLLRQNGRSVDGAGSLGELIVPQTGAGTMIVSGASGTATPDQAREVLDWVRRGNTLIAEPRWISPAEKALVAGADDEEEAEEETEDDAEEEAEAQAAGDDASTSGEAAPPPGDASGGNAASAAPAAPAAPEAPEADDDSDKDPLTEHLRVRTGVDALACKCRTEAKEKDKDKPEAIAAARLAREQALSRLTLPGKDYALQIDADGNELVGLPDSPAPLWSDSDGGAVRVYAEGKGRIVLIANGYFTNSDLPQRDHAELLLALTELTPGKHVTIVKRLNVLPWYKALWRHYKLALTGLAVCLALLLWSALRRFGPILPAPKAERRSLLEHIDASGAWLWKADGGRQLLIEAAREDTLALIKRRAPALFRMPEGELWATLARTCALPEADVSEALEQDAASHVTRFTRQIRTLQTLRNHYER